MMYIIGRIYHLINESKKLIFIYNNDWLVYETTSACTWGTLVLN